MAMNRTKEELAQLKGDESVYISELAALADMRLSTLKFYAEENLLPFEQQGEKLRRRFKKQDALKRIRDIKRLQSEGQSLDAIKAHFSVK